MKYPSQNEATLEILKQQANRWVPMPEIMEFTGKHCHSACYAIHSRASELRDMGYDVKNKQMEVEGVKQSCYKLVIGPGALQALKAKFTLGEKIPHFNQLKDYQPKGVQSSMFETVGCAV